MNNQNDYKLIKTVVDKYFEFMTEIDGNLYVTEWVPPSMVDTERKGSDYSYWLPIPSVVTNEELRELEEYFGHKLPGSFVYFLKQKNFIELQLGQYGIGFFRNLPGQLVTDFKEIIDGRYWMLPERNYLPFAHLMDFGVLCFDANIKSDDSNYPVVLFDHNDGYGDAEIYANSFYEMFFEFDSHLDNWIENNREIRRQKGK